MESGGVNTLGWPSVVGSHNRLQSSRICALVALVCCLLGVQVFFFSRVNVPDVTTHF